LPIRQAAETVLNALGNIGDFVGGIAVLITLACAPDA